jgi:hypothetical protein
MPEAIPPQDPAAAEDDPFAVPAEDAAADAAPADDMPAEDAGAATEAGGAAAEADPFAQ